MMKFYDCNPLFDRETYVACLRKIGVDSEVVDGGVMLNIEQYKTNIHTHSLPMMITMNHQWIKQLY